MEWRLRTQTDQKEYPAVDLAKWICAILVVMIHIAPFGTQGRAADCLNFILCSWLAKAAVPFFFAASGFFLYRKTTLDQFSTGPTKKYALRLLRLYATWTLIYLPLLLPQYANEEKGVFFAFIKFLRNCIFRGSYFQLWYLPASIFGAIYISFLLHKGVQPHNIVLIAFCFYFIGLFGQSWSGFTAPIQQNLPGLWNLMELARLKVYCTTRDGLFDGFFFMSLGMLFAFYEIRLPKRSAAAGFAASTLLLLAEIWFLERYHISWMGQDTYLLAAPQAFFLFYMVQQAALPKHAACQALRTNSSFVFYSHMLFFALCRAALAGTAPSLTDTGLPFLLTAASSIVCGMVLVWLTKVPALRGLKCLYN